MAKIAVGLFDNIEDARLAVEELVNAGFQRERISLVANSSTGEIRQYFDRGDRLEEGEEIGEGALGGAGLGAVVGGLGGLLVGLGALAIPGIGPVLAAGPLAPALAGAGIGAAAGGLLGALVKAGIPSEEAEIYSEGVRRGGTLVTVNTSDEMANRAVDILNRHNPVDVEKRAQTWRQDNWQGFDESAEPFPVDRIETERSRFPEDLDTDIDTRISREDKTTYPVVEEELRAGKRELDKQSRIVDEIEVSKDLEEHTETIRDSQRHTEVDIEDMNRGSTASTEMRGLDDYENFFREHYNTNYGMTSNTYEQYRPYYEYGWQLATDERFRNRSWEEIEMDARNDWERSHPYSMWDEFSSAVREGWQRATGRG